MSRFSVALRIAWRGARRQRGQSALVAALIALPVIGLAGGSVVYWSMQATPTEQVRAQLGHAQAKITDSTAGAPIQQSVDGTQWGGDSPSSDWTQPSLTSLLPAGTRVIGLADTSAMVRTATGVGGLSVTLGETWDPSFRGRFDLVSGRAPANAHEALVTQPTLARLGISVGGSVQLESPVATRVTVVGVLTDTSYPRSHEALYLPSGALGDIGPDTYYLPSTPVSWAEVQRLNQGAYTVFSRQVVLDPPRDAPSFGGSGGIGAVILLISMLAAFSALEVGLLAGAAMLVGAKQQQRTLATIAATGASRRTLIAVISSRGLVLGLVGGVLGVGLGILGAGVYLHATSDGSAAHYPGFHLPWPLLIGMVVFAVAVGWVSALIPAVNASRFDVVSVLRGSRAPRPASRRGVIAGLVVLACGAGLTLLAGTIQVANVQESTPFTRSSVSVLFITGPIAMILGLIFATPLVLTLIGRVFAGAGRSSVLATRDAARNRGRSVPAIATTMAAVFLAAFAMTTFAGQDAENRDGYSYTTMPGEVEVAPAQSAAAPQPFDGASILAALRSTMPSVTSAAVLREPRELDMQEYNGAGNPPPPSDTAMNVGVAIPPANLCPKGSPQSSHGSGIGTADGRNYSTLAKDPRCRDLAVVPDEEMGSASARIVVGDASVLRLLLDAKPSAAAVAALAAGDAVSLHPLLVQDGKLGLEFRSDKQVIDAVTRKGGLPAPRRTATLDAVVDQPAKTIQRFAVVIPPQTAARLGIDVVDGEVLGTLSRMPTDAERDAMNLAAGQQANVGIESGPSKAGAIAGWVALGASSLIALASAIVALGLARIDGRQDDATLTAIGASRRTRRGVAFWQAIMLTGTGALFGTATGVLTAFAFALPGSGAEFAPPWGQLAIAAVGLPLAIAAAMLLLVREPRFELSRRAAIA